MAHDFEAIRRDNERRYGTDIGRVGQMLLADRYDDRTHFIFELLQNAEDALARRESWQGSRAVSFQLTERVLRVGHFGLPFDDADVRGICGIAESRKELTAIGRFGIGFKSVYAFTDRPEVHSGTDAFAIESFVWPFAAPKIEHDPDETVILIPLNSADESGHDEIATGLGRLGAATLLFLHQIEAIHWAVEGGRSGLYLRDSKQVDPGVRRVTLIGQEHGQPEVDEEWLVFSRLVTANDDRYAGHVELAFCLAKDEDGLRERIERVERSPLVVFFPTVLETHLGFLLQGPYRTTPSRDNAPRSDRWNQHLVGETASLLAEALRWLRDHSFLDTAGLRCLPLDPMKFGGTSMFAPLYEATKSALSSEPLLPRFDAGYVPAAHAWLGRTQELRELFTPTQLSTLYGEGAELSWLSGDITPDRTPELRRYLMQELNVVELTPETVISRLDRRFLEAQPDDWILRLYGFLSGQPGLRWRIEGLPLIRLENGSHVPPHADGQAQAFLPGPITTGFPTIRAAVCASETAREFLCSLGLTEPDPVDDVIRNVLPKYRTDEVEVGDADYDADIHRILSAFTTDSKSQREKLVGTLRDTAFVMSIDAGDGSKRLSQPGEAYLATERLKELFADVKGVLLVDDARACLRGEEVRELFKACGATRYLQTVTVGSQLTREERCEIRREAGLERSTWERPIVDATLRGLDLLLDVLPRLGPNVRRDKAALLWEALSDLESQRGSGVFVTEYSWGYAHESKTATLDAAFVRCLNETDWVPDANGDLQRPEFVLFDTLGWKPSPFLQSKIRFKPPVIETLAREAGIEPGLLDLLKKLGVTTEAELRSRFGIEERPETPTAPAPVGVAGAIEKLLGETPAPTPPVPDPMGAEPTGSGGSGGAGGGTGSGTGGATPAGTRGDGQPGGRSAGAGGGNKRTPGSQGGRPFISYVGAHPDDSESDPDGLDQQARMDLEEMAIRLVIGSDPGLQPTPVGNPGYDLFEAGEDGGTIRWVEVKAMTGSLADRPIGLSHTQFECAREHGEAYWIYVVEHTGSAEQMRLVRIQDPAGKARTFTFDHGWLHVATTDEPSIPAQEGD